MLCFGIECETIEHYVFNTPGQSADTSRIGEFVLFIKTNFLFFVLFILIYIGRVHCHFGVE